jgi:DNA-binding PadR family transcriptional regulator
MRSRTIPKTIQRKEEGILEHMGRKRRLQARIRPNARMYSILKDMGMRGAMSVHGVYGVYWAGRVLRTCQEKLDQWEKAGFITSRWVEARNTEEKVYMLTRKGRAMFDEEAKAHFYKSNPTEIEMAHVLHVSDYMSSLPGNVVKFVNERELRSHNAALPEDMRDAETTDGYIEVESASGGKVGYSIEIDSNACGRTLYLKCRGLCAKAQKSEKKVKYILYSKARLRAVTSALRKVREESGIEIILAKDGSKP